MDLYAVVDFIFFLQPAEDGYRVLDRGLRDHDRLETSFKGGILFDILAGFVEGRCAYAVQLASCKHRLEQVAGIHCAVGLACADYCMKLIDEEDDLPFARFNFIQDGFQTLLEFAAVFCAGDECAHIKREYLAVLQIFRDIALDDTLGKSFGYCGLTDAGFTDEAGVVFCLTGKNTDDVSYLLVTSDDRVELLALCKLHKVLTVLFEDVVGCLGVFAVDGAVASDAFKSREECLIIHVAAGENVAELSVGL
ncbi:putative uncharacterized protein [Candidatus Colimorpha enterica]|uniref:Uncharacterized protein n=1 Tax=Candidatus Colimorpha enterica TaxID=3083063 RepID=R6U1F1_9BACT|nr:putative uncharacterized protein [Candidatus Colimorpha enterica]